ncbi:MAG TPA: rhomboid family intramembrane serine protease, partial [Longimicrobium sp.]|nr:rhomboid family intramembrane serine protease [Longimicrobium sp.]
MPTYSSSSYGSPFRGTVTPVVRWLLIANTAVFGASLVFALMRMPDLAITWLGLQPSEAIYRPWTVLTYAFVHAGVGHWFFNMITLFFFGPRLEERWGARP